MKLADMATVQVGRNKYAPVAETVFGRCLNCRTITAWQVGAPPQVQCRYCAIKYPVATPTQQPPVTLPTVLKAAQAILTHPPITRVSGNRLVHEAEHVLGWPDAATLLRHLRTYHSEGGHQ